jgi:RHS repeat-associated protein
VANIFTYDAYGTLIASNTTAQTFYLYSGQQFDPDLGQYYLRARTYNQGTGRFWTMDTYQGNSQDPQSLHKYLYAQDNPVDGSDPSGNDDLDSMSMAVYSSAFLSSLNIIESVGVVPASIAPYPVVVVTLPNGTQYMPKTKVKDSAQVAIAGVPINTPIYISVPPTENPQAMVNYWSTHSFYDNEFAFRDYFKGGGTHDYKLKNSIWDAFGNFNYGACGEAAGVPHWLLQHEANKGKPGGNNPINTADINSGFDAIAKGGKLSTKMESLVPPSSSP